MAKAKDSNGAAAAPARKRTLKSAQPAPEPKKNVFPINLDEEIRKRAYELYEQRGGGHGHDVADWLQAESELRLSPPSRRSP